MLRTICAFFVDSRSSSSCRLGGGREGVGVPIRVRDCFYADALQPRPNSDEEVIRQRSGSAVP